jgi:hypothetical protein
MHSGRKGPDPEPLSENEKRHLSKYGRLPRGALLAQQSKKERHYFDSGDFAISTTDNVSIYLLNLHSTKDHLVNNVPVISILGCISIVSL